MAIPPRDPGQDAEQGGRLEPERSGSEEPPPLWILRLFVAGSTPRSLQAIEHVRRFCDQYLMGACDLEVVDIYQQPEMAQAAGIIAAPALIRQEPLPRLRLTGDLSDIGRLLAGLGSPLTVNENSP
jgi:circadian clock protein KaiB